MGSPVTAASETLPWPMPGALSGHASFVLPSLHHIFSAVASTSISYFDTSMRNRRLNWRPRLEEEYRLGIVKGLARARTVIQVFRRNISWS
jgi:hypothetical protein